MSHLLLIIDLCHLFHRKVFDCMINSHWTHSSGHRYARWTLKSEPISLYICTDESIVVSCWLEIKSTRSRYMLNPVVLTTFYFHSIIFALASLLLLLMLLWLEIYRPLLPAYSLTLAKPFVAFIRSMVCDDVCNRITYIVCYGCSSFPARASSVERVKECESEIHTFCMDIVVFA